MTDNELLNILLMHFPHATGIMVQDNDQLLIILDAQFSILTDMVISGDSVNLHVWGLPLCDMENFLWDQSFDHSGRLLGLLSNGKIIKDSGEAVFSLIQQQATAIYKKVSLVNIIRLGSYTNALKELNDEFDGKLTTSERFFVLNEMIEHITHIEYTRLTNWSSTGVSKAKILVEDGSSEFKELIKHLQLALSGQKIKMLPVKTLISYYLSLPFHDNHQLSDQAFLVFDIWYPGIGYDNFITEFLPHIEQHPLLSRGYQFFYLSPQNYKHLYRYNICLVFRNNTKTGNEHLFSEFEEVLKNFNRSSISSILPTCIYTKDTDNNYTIKLGKVLCKISLMNKKLIISNSGFSPERNMVIGIIFFSYLLKYFQLDKDDIIKLNFYMTSRWLLSDQMELQTSSNQSKAGNAKYDIYRNYYARNAQLVNDAVKKGFTLDQDESDDKIYSEVIKELKRVIDREEAIILDRSLSILILENDYKIKESGKALKFVLIIENLVAGLLLNNNQAALCFYSLGQSVSNFLPN